MKYHANRWLAIATGMVAATWALALLLQEPIATGQWSMNQFSPAIATAVTIALGILFSTARKSWRLIYAVGFLVAFLYGTFLTIYVSVGNQKTMTGNKALTVESHNKAIGAKREEISKAKERLATAETMVERETANKNCGRACNDWKSRAAEVRSHLAILEVQLARLGSERIAQPQASAMAGAAATLFGIDASAAEVKLSALEPFALPLFLDLVAIIALGYGLHGPRPATVAQPVKQALTFERPLTDAEIEELRRKLQSLGGRVEMQDDLARHLGVHKGEASKRIAKAVKAGVVRQERNGRSNAVVLNRLH